MNREPYRSHTTATHRRSRRVRTPGPVPRILLGLLSVLAIAAVGLICYAGVIIYKAKTQPTSLFQPQDGNNLATLAPNTTPAAIPEPSDLFEVDPGHEATPAPRELRGFELIWADEGYRYNDDIITVVFMGIDVLKERGPLGFRADTIILGVIDSRTGKVSMVSIPRDTYTLIQKVDEDGTVYATEMNRVNAAFAYGQGRHKYSYQNTMEAISYLLGDIPIKFYIGFDMDGMVDIVNCVGGVSVRVEESVAAAAEIPAGTYRLTGEQALQFVRVRKTVGGDPKRIQRQQELVISFLSDIKRRNPVEYVPRLYDAVQYYMNTNLSVEQMAALAVILKDLNMDDIQTYTLSGESATINTMSVWRCDQAALEQLIRDLYFIKE